MNIYDWEADDDYSEAFKKRERRETIVAWVGALATIAAVLVALWGISQLISLHDDAALCSPPLHAVANGDGSYDCE